MFLEEMALKRFSVYGKEDLKIGLERLRNRLIAFRDEHLKLGILPMIQDLADITCLDVNPNSKNQRGEKRTNFEVTVGHQTVKNEITNHRPVEFAIFLIQGTVITHYNREAAIRIQTGQKFQNILDQMMYLSEQKAKRFGQYMVASEKFDIFKEINKTDIDDQVRIQILMITYKRQSFRKPKSKRNLTRRNPRQSKRFDQTCTQNIFQTKTKIIKDSIPKKSAKNISLDVNCQSFTVESSNPNTAKSILDILLKNCQIRCK